MSNPRLPAEMLDHIVDRLHDTENALRNCCLVSKSWIPRARKHLFAHVWFETEYDLESWEGTFPDPSTSPGRYAKTLTINCPHAIRIADGGAEGWIRGFSHVVHLEIGSSSRLPGTYDDHESATFLVSLQGLSPFVKSLKIDCVGLPSSRIFDLILSFPLLEDLTMSNRGSAGVDEDVTFLQPSNPPALTGSLQLVAPGMAPIANQLLSLQGGIRFRRFTSTWDRGEDVSLITALVERCSHTLKSLDICCDPLGASIRRLHPYR